MVLNRGSHIAEVDDEGEDEVEVLNFYGLSQPSRRKSNEGSPDNSDNKWVQEEQDSVAQRDQDFKKELQKLKIKNKIKR